MFRIGICEDEEAMRSYEEQLVKKWVKEQKLQVETVLFANAEQFLFQLEDNGDFDAVLLDIQMGQMNGMELAEHLRAKGYKGQILFLTGIMDYALDGYRVGAVRYLLKPIKEKEFISVLDELYRKLSKQENKFFLLEQGSRFVKIAYDRIVYVEARGHYVYLKTDAEEYQWKAALSSVAEEMEQNGFFLLRRGLYINIAHVAAITRTECALDCGEKLPVARNRYKELNEAFFAYYRGQFE